MNMTGYTSAAPRSTRPEPGRVATPAAESTIRLLRPVWSDPSKLTHPFEIHAAPLTDLRVVSMQGWIDEILGPRGSPVDLAGAAHRFRAAVDGVDFLFPSHGCAPALPMLLLLRNRARCRTRLLFYSDTSATLCLWWALLRPLLRPGDRIVAPTESARRTIEFVCADVAPHLRVCGYPMPLPPEPAIAPAARAPVLTSMTRMGRTKLLHRQIEALAILKRRGLDARMNIVGDLGLPATGLKPYGLALGALTQRLGLSDQVSFPGLVTDETAKAALWAQSSAALNLSVTPEESFGRSPVEALGMGVPVVATRFDGFIETVGSAGELVPVVEQREDLLMLTATAEAVADAIERVLADPPSAGACRAQASRFEPHLIMPRFLDICEEALAERDPLDAGDGVVAASEPAAPAGGLLATTAPLTEMSWHEAFDEAQRDVASWRVEDYPEKKMPFALLVATGTAPWTLRFMAGIPRPSTHGPTLSSRVACLDRFGRNDPDLRARLLETFSDDEQRHPTVVLMRAMALLDSGHAADAHRIVMESFDACFPCDEEGRRLRDLSALLCKAGHPDHALARLAAWLERYPDSFNSGEVWGQFGLVALSLAPPHIDGAKRALERCRALLGEQDPTSRRLEERLTSVPE
jgi:glycosyltransferase involved in cell wall biosynthesis